MIRPISLALLATALVAGCDDSSDAGSPMTATTDAPSATTEPAPEPVAGLIAELGTNRLYAVDRAFGLVLQNVGNAPVVVREMQLDSVLFAFRPPSDREVPIAPGQRLVVPLPYGEVRCDDEPGPTFPVALVVGGGEVVHLDAAEEYDGAVARLHARECAAADVLERVTITFGDTWTEDGITVAGELHVEQRHAGAPVAIDDAVGNVIFTLITEQAHPVLRVSDEKPSATVPVTISADRCDPHAVAEFKTPFLFLSWIAVGDAGPVPVPLEVTGTARTALEQLIARCST